MPSILSFSLYAATWYLTGAILISENINLCEGDKSIIVDKLEDYQ